MSREEPEHIQFANLCFKGLKRKHILQEDEFLKFIVTVNAEIIVKANNDSKLKQIINNNYSTFDGQVPFLLAKIQFSNVPFEKISGSDLIYDFCEMAMIKNKRIFLLGGNKEINKRATDNLKKKYKIEIKGFSPEYKDYPFDYAHNQLILEKIQSFRPMILFVGFGASKQEFWIHQFKQDLEKLGVRWVVGCGGTFGFASGHIKRAPKWVQICGLEGVYRFFQEPNETRFNRLILSSKIFKYI